MLDHPCRKHRIVGLVLTGLLTFVLVAAGLGKLLAEPPPDAPVKLSTLTVQVLAVIDVLLAAGLWVPRTRTMTFVLTVGYFGGATATHLVTNQSFGLQAGLIAFTLLAAYFRSPELFLRLLGKESLAEGQACAVPPTA